MALWHSASSPGSWALSDIRILQRAAGETLMVTCNYPSPGTSYKEKGLCREVAGFMCAKLVPSTGAQGQTPRLSIWDNPAAGLFIVSLAGLKKDDSGHYWCSMRHASSNTVFNSVKFYLAVSPGEPFSPLRAPFTSFQCLPSAFLAPKATCHSAGPPDSYSRVVLAHRRLRGGLAEPRPQVCLILTQEGIMPLSPAAPLTSPFLPAPTQASRAARHPISSQTRGAVPPTRGATEALGTPSAVTTPAG